ncbi:GAF and ANTAR domain-containing protein [Nocardia sp. NPDC052001]|uniref:GAF and ANTAR domain-containing protein n=1 Tax=Nocardia sp. NPDC052001 TaxID=3154853 RepID=UPI0034377AB5
MTERERTLMAAFVRLADTLVADYDPVEVTQELLDTAGAMLPLTAAGVLLVDEHDRLQVLASTNEATRLLELFQLQADAGPCLSAYATGQPVLVRDLDLDPERWPAFAGAARGQGLRSVYAIPLRLREERLGAMNLFCDRTNGLDDDEIAVARALADVTAIGIVHARVLTDSLTVSAQLQIALNHRVLIEQAKGMLAQQISLDMHSAFTLLRGYARRTNTRVPVLAQAIIDRTVTAADLVESAQNASRRSADSATPSGHRHP